MLTPSQLSALSLATGVAPHAIVRVLAGQAAQETTHAAVCAEARRMGLLAADVPMGGRDPRSISYPNATTARRAA